MLPDATVQMHEQEAQSYTTHKCERAAQSLSSSYVNKNECCSKIKLLCTRFIAVLSQKIEHLPRKLSEAHAQSNFLTRLFTEIGVLRGQLKSCRKVKKMCAAAPVQKASIHVANGTALRGSFSAIVLNFQSHRVQRKCRLLVLVATL